MTKSRSGITIHKAYNSGADNSGEFIKNGSTVGADFKVDIEYEGRSLDKHPLEFKFVPTAGKFSLKEADLRSYIHERASILFVYNSRNSSVSLKKPSSYKLDEHIARIESKRDDIRWGIMWYDRVKKLLSEAKEKNLIRPIYYMGGKSGIILPQAEFYKWFTEEKFE